MFFIISNNNNFSKQLLRYKAVIKSRKIILSYKLSNSEKILDNYCIQHYNKSLKLLCIELLNKVSWKSDNDGNIIGTFKNKMLDNIATTITYGNGVIQGSKILRIALSS